MPCFELFARDQSLKHSPSGFGDVASRLADHAHLGTEQTQRLEVVHYEERYVPRYLEAFILDRRNDALTGDVARREEGARSPGSSQNLAGRVADFLPVEAEIIDTALCQRAR